MDNSQLIFKATCQHIGISEDAGFELLQAGQFPAFHTYEGWKMAGYQVQKGEKAEFSAKIWKMTIKKTEDGTATNKLIMKNSFFFSRQQVKPIN